MGLKIYKGEPSGVKVFTKNKSPILVHHVMPLKLRIHQRLARSCAAVKLYGHDAPVCELPKCCI